MEEHRDFAQHLTIEPGEVAYAVTLADGALKYGAMNWTVDHGVAYEQYSVTQNQTSQGYRCLLGAKLQGTNDDEPVTIVRYILDTGTGHFLAIPERYNNADEFDEACKTGVEEADIMLLRMGMFLPTQSDWNDFKQILETGKGHIEKHQMDIELQRLLGRTATESKQPDSEPDVSQ